MGSLVLTHIEDVFKLLEKEDELKIREYKDVILILGNTGAGKSTFTHFLVGDNTQLQSVEIGSQTGEYTIKDDNNKIGAGHDSKTLYPERVVDLNSGIAYYDCPGFGDTRNAAYDIASNYFIKKITCHVRTVKLVLLVNYSSVRVGVDRFDFMKFIKHVTEFITDIEQFRNSIALVVTKVDNDCYKVNGQYITVPNDKIISKIANFISDAKICLEERLHNVSSTDERVYYQKAITLIDILLQEDRQSNKVKIALFRRPDEAGVISEIDLLQKGKAIIQTMIGSNITFAKLNGNGFGFSISDSSKNSVLKLFETISADITADISSTKEYFYESIKAQVKNSNNISHLNEELDLLYMQSKEILQKMQNSSNLNTFLVLFVDYLNLLDVRNGKSIFLKLFKKCDHIEFLEEISNERCLIKPMEWIKPLQDVLEYILQTKQWYEFLTDLYEKLSSYKLHTNVMNDKFLKKVVKKNEYINLSNLSKIVKFLKKHNMKVEVDTQNTNISDIQFQDLNSVFHALNTNDVTITYSSRGDLVIKGSFVTSTDIIRNVQNHNKKSVHVFALNTFYINEDIDFTGTQVNLLIIAPKWEVIGERRIVLDGASSEGLSMPKAEVEEEGSPGCPGGPAGCFIGFCCNVINDEFLTISANGGNGGPGQDGGDGIPGRDAVEGLPYGDEQTGKQIIRNYCADYTYKKCDRESYFNCFWFKEIPKIVGLEAEREIDVIHVIGREAQKGGDGYKAGCGGFGGFSGTISLFGVEVSKIKITNSNGRNGHPGTGGKGGRGGKNADDYTCTFTQRNDFWFGWKFMEGRFGNWQIGERISKGYAPAGDDNTEISNVGIQVPESVILFEIEPYVINDCKKYLLSNLSNKVSKSELLKFYQYFSNNIHVKGTYDSLALAYELIDLEKEYCKSNNVELDNLYKDLLNRVLEHTENRQDYKKLQIYLCSAILSKIANMRCKSEDDLVIDIDSYFSLIINNFRHLLKSMDTVAKNEYNYSYKKAIETKITEAKYMVNQNIDREIDYINKKIESKMHKILQDIYKEQKSSKEAFSEIKRNQLQTVVEHKTTTRVFGFCKNILSCMFSFGKTITNIIQGACNIADSFGLGNLVNKNPIISLIKTADHCINKVINYVQNSIGRKIEALKHFVEILFEKINKHSNEVENIIQVVNKILQYITKDNNNNINPKQITSLIDQVKQEIQKKITSLEKAIKNKKGGQSFQILNILKNLFNRITLVDAHTDTYLLYKDNKAGLDQICASHITEIEASCKTEVLREFEIYIHTNIHPTFLMMRNTIKEYQSSLPSQSRIALDISKWKLQTVFKDIKILLKKFVEKFELDNDLLQILDKLDDTMNVLITIYDKIQHYNEQKELADYIAFMTSERCSNIPVQNDEIKNALIKLDYCIKANIIFGQFKKGIASFKQFSFPFADRYLEEYHMPIDMKIEEVNLENLVDSTSKQIENLRSKMIENRSLLIKNFHQHIYEGYFQNGEKFGPFCIWESNKYKEAISRLLSGEEIVLYADILKNNIDKNAIKFNAIQINFKSVDKSLEKKLNSVLKHFDVTATHMGNSYYRCNNRFYLLTSDSQTFYYSFEKDRTGESIRMNEVYSKIKKGPYLLSPYTTWSFQLKNVSGNFSELNEFKGKTDLELVGRGQYVSDECFISDVGLNKYYKVVDTLSVTDVLKH